MYELDINIKLHETDAAGVLFFGNYFKLAHDTYEQYMQSIGFDFRYIIDKASYLILIVHAESDFHKPVYVGDAVRVTMSVEKIRHTSFELVYYVSHKNSQQEGNHFQSLPEGEYNVATVKTVHVVVDKETGKPMSLPDQLKAELEKLIQPA